jgi:hypothetical protein
MMKRHQQEKQSLLHKCFWKAEFPTFPPQGHVNPNSLYLFEKITPRAVLGALLRQALLAALVLLADQIIDVEDGGPSLMVSFL